MLKEIVINIAILNILFSVFAWLVFFVFIDKIKNYKKELNYLIYSTITGLIFVLLSFLVN